MPSDGPSLLSMSAAGFYAVVVAVCLIAAGTAGRLRQPSSHWQTWATIALIFAVLAAMRMIGLEETLRDALRELLRVEMTYDTRRSFQRPLAAAVIVVATAIAAIVLVRRARVVKGRRNIVLLIAAASGLAMALLMTLRIISLHQVDAVLYGPLKLNWVADIGASLVVLVAAVLYVRLVRQRP